MTTAAQLSAVPVETRSGFIIHTTMTLEAGAPVIWLYVRADDGSTFVVRDTRFRPYMYVAASHAAALVGRNGVTLQNSTRTTMRGIPVVRVESTRGNLLRQIQQDLQSKSIPCFEADLKPTSRYMIDHKLRGGIRVTGSPRKGPEWLRVDRVYDDPNIEPLPITTPLRMLSFDLETNADASQIWSIALHQSANSGAPNEVLLLSERDVTLPNTRVFPTEKALLSAFVAAVQARDPDVLTGWNVIDFDLSVLLKRAAACRVPLTIGRDPSLPAITTTDSFWSSSKATVNGRMVLDGMQLVRGSFINMEEWGLDFVANKVLGVGKTAHGMAEIAHMYANDLPSFVHYNMNDAELVTRIVDKLDLLNLAMTRCALTGMQLDRVSASIASFDSLYLPELAARGVVADTVNSDEEVQATLGGLVLEPKVGLHHNVFVFDFKSLYPSVMRTFHIDPLAHARATEQDIEAPNGARFSREPAILAGILNQLWTQRDQAKREKNEVKSYAIKILMNSLYGVLGSPTCRFHDTAVANAITGFGRELLEWTRQHFIAAGHDVIYGDTDSVFVKPGDIAPDTPRDEVQQRGYALVAALNQALDQHVQLKWGVPSQLELEMDTLYERLFLPPMRNSIAGEGEQGARKRYVGKANGELVFTGMEVVRRDWTDLAKEVQRELYARLFNDHAVDEYLKDIVRQVRGALRDHQLVYRKSLRKPLESYTASTPPHVAAARKSSAPVGKLIAYVITLDGPETTDQRKHDLDREHYVEKQLRPIAEPVLELLGFDFDDLCALRRQLRLF